MITKSRELIEAERLLKPLNRGIGFAYATTKNHELRALSVDGVCTLIKIGIHHRGETFTNFGSYGGCSSESEGDALATIQQSIK